MKPWLILLFGCGLASLAAEPRLPRDQLLLARDARGEVTSVRSTEDWQRRRADIVRGMESVMGPLPRPLIQESLDPRVIEEVDCGTYVRRRLTYQSERGNRVPAYLCIPKAVLLARDGTQAPAVLCLHPTDTVVGAGVVVGLGPRPNRSYASELAARGYVTIAPGYPHLADYAPDIFGLGYASGTMKAIRDNQRALDLLETLPYVRRGGFGVIGHSLGGHNAVYTAVFEPRLVAVVSSCGLDSYLDYYGGRPDVWKHGKGWCQDRYMPRLAEYAGRLDEIPFDFHEMIAALAPRPVFLSAPLRDGNFQWQSVDRVAAAAREVYRLHGAGELLRVEHPDSDHDFPDAMREIAYQLFDSVLRAAR